MERTQVQELLGGRRDLTPIAVQTDTLAGLESGAIALRLMELAAQKRWQLISLGKFAGHHPTGVPRGAIVTDDTTEPMVGELQRLGVPTVRIALGATGADSILPAIMQDWQASGRLAVDHFAQRDFRHVAFVGSDPWASYRPAYEGLAARAKERGCECHLLRVSVDKFRSAVTDDRDLWRLWQERFTAWMAGLCKPVGLLVESDVSADRDCQWLTEAGLRVPEDVAVLGMGNQRFVCESAPVPISSVAFDPQHFAEAAVTMLDQLMTGRSLHAPATLVSPLGVVTRQSTDVLAATDPAVVQALRFMWDNITANLTVDQVARRVGVHRRTLERAFRRELGRGINQEYQRRRLEKACELLLQTELRIADIARAMNFGTHHYFCRSFRSTFGMSPGAYRRRHAATGPDVAADRQT
jgi:LacI family transcriptional regulator